MPIIKDIRGDIDHLRMADQISKMKAHKERVDYMGGLDEKHANLCYILSMQGNLSKTIANLPTREERRKAWEELPDHTRSLHQCKDLVKHRVKLMFKGTLKGRK
tara:strand:- start:5220 stop:5531 length:312 start_codon:yes stop_codon:yes gene_type:complete